MDTLDAMIMYNKISEMEEDARILGMEVKDLYRDIDVDKMLNAKNLAKQSISKTCGIKIV